MKRYGVSIWEIFSVSFSRPIAEDEKKSATIFQLLNDVISARSSLEYRFKTRWLSFILICTKHRSAKILQWKTQFESGANVFEFGRAVVVALGKNGFIDLVHRLSFQVSIQFSRFDGINLLLRELIAQGALARAEILIRLVLFGISNLCAGNILRVYFLFQSFKWLSMQ